MMAFVGVAISYPSHFKNGPEVKRSNTPKLTAMMTINPRVNFQNVLLKYFICKTYIPLDSLASSSARAELF